MTVESHDSNKGAQQHGSSTAFVDLTEGQLDALLERIEQAKTHGLALSVDDYELLTGALLMLANMQERLESNDLSVLKLRKLLGMVRSTEKLRDLAPATGDQSSDAVTARENRKRAQAGKSKRHKPRKKAPANKPQVHNHALEGVNKGDVCSQCSSGKLYKYTPAVLLRVTGNAPLTCHRHLAQQYRCNGCGEIYSASLPDHVTADGPRDQQYGYSARSVLCISKYFAGSPFYRQEHINGLLGTSISASTIFDQCEKVANALNPIFKAIKRTAANATLFYLDDTTNRILEQKPVMKKSRDGRERLRSGIYTSAVLAITEDKKRLVLFETNVGHAGEFMHEILNARDSTCDPPLLMSDALSANHVAEHEFSKCLCNAHARRGFVELVDKFPDEVIHALELYQHAWVNEVHCVDNALTPEQRTAYHKEHSLPHLKSLKEWCHEKLDSDAVESNSNLGKAMQYYIRHFQGLSAFCRILKAPLDNNEIERMIKIIVRARKNSLFFKTSVGADISDIITSVLAICNENEVNAFDYLNAVQRNQAAVKASPEKWLPWNFPTDR